MRKVLLRCGRHGGADHALPELSRSLCTANNGCRPLHVNLAHARDRQRRPCRAAAVRPHILRSGAATKQCHLTRHTESWRAACPQLPQPNERCICAERRCWMRPTANVHCQPIARGGQRGYGRKLLPQDLRGFLLPYIPRPSQSNNQEKDPQSFDKLQRASLQVKSGKHCSMVPQYTQVWCARPPGCRQLRMRESQKGVT